jgi:gas vesicle protein
MIMSKKRVGGLIAGLAVGAGLGLLFAPKKGSELRQDLADKCNELWNKAKDIDVDEVKKDIDKRIKKLQKEVSNLDKEKVLAIAREKGEDIKKQAEDLVKLAKEKGTPVLEKAASDVRTKTIEVLNNTVEKLEAAEKTTKKKSK